MQKTKSKFKKITQYSAIVSFILAAVSAVFLFIKTDELGLSDPVAASWLASLFFFIFIGISLVLISGVNLPSFKFEDHPKD